MVANRLIGATDLINIIHGDIVIDSVDRFLHVSPGMAVLFLPGQPKKIRNEEEATSAILSFLDPAWRPEIFELLEES